jgi:tetratricopeptide (TPR) repeat protein
MKRFLLAAAAVCLALSAQADTILLKDTKKNITGTIAFESAQGVKLRGQKAELIQAERIRDIDYYDTMPPDIKLTVYRKATNYERDALTAKTDKERLKHLDEAIAWYGKVFAKLTPKEHRFQRRHVAFKAAYLLAQKADIEGTDAARTVAVAKLKEFKTTYSDCWQLGLALQTLARLQIEQKSYDDAEETLTALAAAPVSVALRQEAELSVAQMAMKAGKLEVARKRLEAVAQKLPPGTPAAQKAYLAQAECLAGLKQLPAARQIVDRILPEAKDESVKAVAYNTLGYCYLKGDQLKDACWAFLWVDVVYNQDKAEHAKALYYLHQVFARLNQGDRARECLEALVNDRQFVGLDFQKKAQEEKGQ